MSECAGTHVFRECILKTFLFITVLSQAARLGLVLYYPYFYYLLFRQTVTVANINTL